MIKFLKNIIVIFLILLITSAPTMAEELIKTKAFMNSEFSLEDIPDIVTFTTSERVYIKDSVVIPKGAEVTADLYQYQKERRWHKSGFFICKLKSYSINGGKPIDISDSDFYFVARRYEKVNGKEATITGTELVVTAAASIFAPGVDIAYFFTKGAIQRKKHKNWFKAGVSNAYDNSICWLWLKGKPIELDEGDSINLKEINKKKAESLNKKLVRRHKKEDIKTEKKALKLAHKKQKKELKELQQDEKEALEEFIETEKTICNNNTKKDKAE